MRLDRWEPAGTIEWKGIYAGIFILGLRKLYFADVIKKKRQSSKWVDLMTYPDVFPALILMPIAIFRSRRFLGTDGTEYKWKCIGEDGQGFEVCPALSLYADLGVDQLDGSLSAARRPS